MGREKSAWIGALAAGFCLAAGSSVSAGDAGTFVKARGTVAGGAGTFVKPIGTGAGGAGTFLKAPGSSGGAGGLVTIDGVKTVKAPPPRAGTEVASASASDALHTGQDAVVIGKPMPLKYMMLFDVAKYGLPKPRDGWVYFKAGDQIYKVILSSRIVLANVTDEATKPVK
jgi:hypothetical protein